MKKTFGTLSLQGDQWVLADVPPHVAIRLKHLFPRVPKTQVSPFHFPNDESHCADLAWFESRYPLLMTKAGRRALMAGEKRYVETQNRMEEILRPGFEVKTCAGLREGQQVRPYQGQAAELVMMRKSLLLGDDVGLGKTYSAIWLCLQLGTVPAAVVVQTHLQSQWAVKFGEFSTLRVHCIKGTQPYNLPEADVYIFKYSQISGWIDTYKDGFFKTVIFDEIQELRTGQESAKGKAAKELCNYATYRLGLSATPIYNYGFEIWNILHVLDETVLGDKYEFIREWCRDDRQVKDPEALGSYLKDQNILLRRTKRCVGQQMPPLNSIIEYVDPDEKALKDVEQLARQLAMRTQTGSFMERGRAGQQLDLLLRHATGVSKAAAVASYVRILADNGVPVLLVGWHRDVYGIWLRELAAYKPVMFTGSESEKQKNEAVRAFVAGETNIFIMSNRSGAGLDGLQFRCSTLVIGELDWSPKVHEQIIGRLDREGQQEQITAIYMISEDGSDPPMVELLGIKMHQSTGIVDPGRQFEAKHSDKSRIQALAAQYLTKKQKAA